MSQPITLTLAQRAPRPLRWLGILLVLGLLSMPFLALLPASHPLAVPSWLLTLSGKILCYAIVAVALDLVWGYDYEGDIRTVDVHIQKLRKKLGLEDCLKTVFKVGYRLENDL